MRSLSQETVFHEQIFLFSNTDNTDSYTNNADLLTNIAPPTYSDSDDIRNVHTYTNKNMEEYEKGNNVEKRHNEDSWKVTREQDPQALIP